MYLVNEVFNSVQGEGLNIGKPSTFIRLQGCTVGCPWCDTKYTWRRPTKDQAMQTAEEILEPWGRDLRPHVVITGGEPTLWNLDELLIALSDRLERYYGYMYMIQMETSGQNELLGQLVPSWITWSPKPRLNFQAPRSIKRVVNEIKIVVDADMTLDIVREIVSNFENDTHRQVPVVLMPEGAPPKPENVTKTLAWLAAEPQYRFGDRLHYRLEMK